MDLNFLNVKCTHILLLMTSGDPIRSDPIFREITDQATPQLILRSVSITHHPSPPMFKSTSRSKDASVFVARTHPNKFL
jgi:hypothetical protein